jgi:hypothetical protein
VPLFSTYFVNVVYDFFNKKRCLILLYCKEDCLIAVTMAYYQNNPNPGSANRDFLWQVFQR